jgi:ankyrin repeat protein
VTTKSLPLQPSLDQLRRQAKDLIRAIRAGDTAAKDRLLVQLKSLSREIESGQRVISLSLAQLAIAREYGFESWPKLKFFVESEQMTFEQKLEAFVRAATSNRLYLAKSLLQSDPKLASHDLSTACLVGDFDLVERLIRQTPSLVFTKVGLKSWEPLLYVCFSYFNRESAETAARLLQIARLLIQLGANVNVWYLHEPEEPGSDNRIPALYGPCGETNFPELASILLEAGAQSEDRESLYHSTEFRDHKCLRLLLKHGADPKKWGALHRMLDFEDHEGAEILLTAGADPNKPYLQLGTALHHAILRGRSARVLSLLLQYGADASIKNPQGYTPYELALRFGHADAKQVLDAGQKPQQATRQELFISACANGDRDQAQELLAQSPNLVKMLGESDRKLIADFAALGKLEAVKLMLDLGFDLNQRGDWGGTVVQQAAWHGQVEVVELLVERGADLEILNDYGGATLGTTVFATAYLKVPENDQRYIAIAETLLEAGAKLQPFMLNMGNEAMSEFLKTYSVGI